MLYAILGLLLLLVDQFMKFWTAAHIELNADPGRVLIPGLLNWTHIRNYGMAFGLFSRFSALRWVLLVLLIAFAAFIVLGIVRRYLRTGFARWTGALLLAGLLSNGVDRAIYGYVVDMLEPRIGSLSLPIFNLADCLVVVFGILFCISVLTGGIGAPLEEEDEDEPPRRVRRSRYDDEDDDEDEPPRRVRRSRREDDEDDDDEEERRRRARAAAAARNREGAAGAQRPRSAGQPARSPASGPRPGQAPQRRAPSSAPRSGQPSQTPRGAQATRPVRPIVSGESRGPAAEPRRSVTVSPAQKSESVTVRSDVAPESEAAVATVARPAPRPAPVPESVVPAPQPEPPADEFDLDSILAEFK